nr:MAG TPA: tail tape measure protein [Caudoviricetes sp.]
MKNVATQLGKAYVQVIPSTKGIKGALEKGISAEAPSAAQGFSSKFSGFLKAGLKTAGVAGVAALSTALVQGGKLQQSIGGIETLFKKSADIVKDYASEAYKTAGVSANSYMEQVTSFSASLIQSLGGDTRKAAKTANMAIIDMADNSNKMGTSIQDIQNAYQGFAKQNFTMLDNLKLGYGGTRTEMERLLQDAEKLTGVKYDINNLDDVFNAIHAIQEELGITGTTAQEATETLTGSFNQMKAAFFDMIGNLALGQNVASSMSNLAESMATFLFKNLIPMVGNVLTSLPGAISSFAMAAGREIMNYFSSGVLQDNSLFQAFSAKFQNLRPLIDAVVDGISRMDFSGISDLASAIIPAITNAFQTFMGIVSPAIEGLINSFVGLWNALQPVISILAEALMPVLQIVGAFLGGVFKGVLLVVTGAIDFLTVAVKLLTPVFDALVAVVKWLAPILTKIAEWVGVLTGLFGGLGTATGGLKNIFSQGWNTMRTVFTGAKDIIVGGIKALMNIFKSLSTAGTSLKTALSNAWSAIKGVVLSVGNQIISKVKSIGNMFNSLKNIDLGAAGRAIMNSFLNGLKAIWGKVTGFIGGIGTWIKNNKGPIEYDRKLLIPAGQAIMYGLNKGLKDEFGEVQENVSGMADRLADSFETFKPNVKLFDLDDELANFNGQQRVAIAQLDNQTIRHSLEMHSMDQKLSELIQLMQAMEELLEQLLDKDTDVYLDGERVSALLEPLMRRIREKKTKYENRRRGELV